MRLLEIELEKKSGREDEKISTYSYIIFVVIFKYLKLLFERIYILFYSEYCYIHFGGLFVHNYFQFSDYGKSTKVRRYTETRSYAVRKWDKRDRGCSESGTFVLVYIFFLK